MEMAKAIMKVREMSEQLRGGGSKSNFEFMLKGWIPAHVDGGHGTYHRPAAHSDNLRPAVKWRGMAQKMFMSQKPPYEGYDIESRIYDVASNISVGRDFIKPLVFEEVFDELQAYADDDGIDVFQVLHSYNRLTPILRVLCNQHANVRAKAAELITAMVVMNPMNAEHVIVGGGLQLLVYNLTEDPDATSRTKAFGAIGAILRNNKPGVIVFRVANGYAALRGPMCSECVGLQRDALELTLYLLRDNSSDCNIVTEFGLHCIMMRLAASSEDVEVQISALKCLFVLREKDDNLHPILQQLVEFSKTDGLSKFLQSPSEEFVVFLRCLKGAIDEYGEINGQQVIHDDDKAPDVLFKLTRRMKVMDPVAFAGEGLLEEMYRSFLDLLGGSDMKRPKAEEIFDHILATKFIKLPDNHNLPPAEAAEREGLPGRMPMGAGFFEKARADSETWDLALHLLLLLPLIKAIQAPQKEPQSNSNSSRLKRGNID